MKRSTASMGALAVAILTLLAAAGAADARVSSKVRGKLAGARAPLSQLQQVSARKGLKATFYRVRQEVEGLPVIDSEALVADVPGQGQRLVDGTRGAVRTPAAATLSARKAESIARGRVSAKRVIYGPRSSKAILVGPGGPRIVWRVVLGTRAPVGSFEVLVDARSGRVVRVRNRIRTASAQVSVFDPNPVVTASDPSTLDPADDDAGADAEATDHTVTVADPDIGDPVCLAGPAATAFDSVGDPVCETTGDFRTSRVDSGGRASAGDFFESGMAYFHLDRTQTYLRQLGFDGAANTAVLAGGITANLNTSTDDNSYYDPGDISLNFGTGGVDDAEDAEVIIHEYGHAIQDDQVPGFGQNYQGGAMGEGFGDYLASSRTEATTGITPDSGCFAEWDSFENVDPPGCLRLIDPNWTRLDAQASCGPGDDPASEPYEVHCLGEAWSGTLWDLRNTLGDSEVADRLILNSHFYLLPTAGFYDAGQALQDSDTELNGGADISAIRTVLAAHQMLRPAGGGGGGPSGGGTTPATPATPAAPTVSAACVTATKKLKKAKKKYSKARKRLKKAKKAYKRHHSARNKKRYRKAKKAYKKAKKAYAKAKRRKKNAC